MEEDIKILEEYLAWAGNDIVEMRGYEKQALENLLKAYKQDEKMIDLMAEMIGYNTVPKDECKDCIKEYFRKKVETNE